ncbi:MAG: hypothetical protein JSU82_14125 [Rhodospirillales bacterium]|nr:MAG: hypothetical protein JSU82_14125 [Rhodospirillales bacterium]
MTGRAAVAIAALSGLLAAGASVAADEACIFDQAAQLAHYREMERRIPGARFDKAERLLTIARGVETITLSRGGCVHFGLFLTHSAPAAPGEAVPDIVFARAVALVEEFGGGELVTAEAVAEAIRNEAFERVQDGFYYLRVPGVEVFSIEWGAADGRLRVEVGYYIN